MSSSPVGMRPQNLFFGPRFLYLPGRSESARHQVLTVRGQNAWYGHPTRYQTGLQLRDNLRSIGSDHELLTGGDAPPKISVFGPPVFFSAWAE